MTAASIAIIAAALTIGSACWLARRWSVPLRTALLIGCSSVLVALPWLAATRPVVERVIVSLVCCAVVPPKLLDAHFTPHGWSNRTILNWLGYLANPFILCYRRHIKDRGQTRRRSTAMLLRGLAETATGAAILRWAFRTDWAEGAFLQEHLVKLAGAYLLVFDGAFVLVNGALGVLGGRYMEFSRHPVLARTPADFWRRYNRDAGRFLYENVYVRIRRDRPKIALFLVFAINGALHEYLALVVFHRLTGLQVAYFTIQGLAVVATSGVRPRGLRRWSWTVGTAAFNVATSVLFFTSIGWYPHRFG